MSGLKNWAVLGSGHFKYRKLSPPVISEVRFHPFLTHFLRGEPDSIFQDCFGPFPHFSQEVLPNGRLVYVFASRDL